MRVVLHNCGGRRAQLSVVGVRPSAFELNAGRFLPPPGHDYYYYYTIYGEIIHKNLLRG